jgi:hypothetical protein
LEFFAINTEGRSRKFFTTNSEGSKNRKQEVEVTAPKTIQLLPLIVIPIVKILTEPTDLTTLTPHGSFVDAVTDALEVFFFEQREGSGRPQMLHYIIKDGGYILQQGPYKKENTNWSLKINRKGPANKIRKQSSAKSSPPLSMLSESRIRPPATSNRGRTTWWLGGV